MIQESINDQIKEAMRAKEALRLEVLRGMKTAFTNELVSLKRTPQDSLSDEEAVTVIKRLSKQRKEALEQFRNAGREDLATKEEHELKILEEFLPETMSLEAILPLAEAKKTEMGVDDKSKIGVLIGALMRDLKGKADGGDVKKAVESLF